MPRDHAFHAPPEPEDELLMLDAGHYFASEYGTTAAEQAAHEPLDARLARERADVADRRRGHRAAAPPVPDRRARALERARDRPAQPRS